MAAGLLITLEGIDGCGKTTLAASLTEHFKKTGYDVLMLREPGGIKTAEKIRALLLDPENEMSAETEAFLYASARAELVKQVLEPELAAGRLIILDRYTDSTLAYQGYGRGLDLSFLASLNTLATGGRVPDLTFFLDLSPEAAAKRRLKRDGTADRMELAGDAFQERVYRGYLEITKKEPERVVPLNAEQSEGDLFADALSALLTRCAAALAKTETKTNE